MTANTFSPGWGHTEYQLQVLSDMKIIAELSHDSEAGRFSLDRITQEATNGAMNEAGRERLRQYAEWGWIDLDEAFGPDEVDGAVLGVGREFTDAVHARREDAAARRRQMRQAVASWALNEHARGVTPARYETFMRSAFGRWYGEPVDAKTYSDATIWLRDAGFATGAGSTGHGLIVLKLTPKGEALIEAGRDLTDVVAAGHDPSTSVATYTTSIVNSPGSSVAAGSPDAHVEAHATITTEVQQQADHYAALLEQLLPAVAPDIDARQVAENVRTGAASGDIGKFRAALTGAQLAFAAAIGTDAGNTLWEASAPLRHWSGLS